MVDELYERGATYREIFDASARGLNLDRISKTLDAENKFEANLKPLRTF
jgi:hypothetical protein